MYVFILLLSAATVIYLALSKLSWASSALHCYQWHSPTIRVWVTIFLMMMEAENHSVHFPAAQQHFHPMALRIR